MWQNRSFFLASCLLALAFSIRPAFSEEPLRPVAKLVMPNSIQGKFDHLGIDHKGGRLFVAAESAHQVLVFDLTSGKYLRSIDGIEIPHAIFVREDLNRIFITDGGAGALKIYDGRTYAFLKAIPLKVDADSIGYDPATHLLYIDNGGGDAHETFSMLSAVDTSQDAKVADMKVDGDTLEAMALEKSTDKMYVNNPAKNRIEVISRKDRANLATWPVGLGKGNVAMALDEAGHRLFVALRSGNISVFDSQTGREMESLPIGKGVDDLAFDPASRRVYAPCGADGMIYIYEERDKDHFALLGKVASGSGGKNALLEPSLGRYFVIVPPRGSVPGAVDVYALQ
jgi:DNA-binding beta-propeller fold protein YncE